MRDETRNPVEAEWRPLALHVDLSATAHRFYGAASSKAATLIEPLTPFVGVDAERRVFGTLGERLVESLSAVPMDEAALAEAVESAVVALFPSEWADRGHAFTISAVRLDLESGRIWIANVGSNVVLGIRPEGTRRVLRSHSAASAENPEEMRATAPETPPGVATVAVSRPGDFKRSALTVVLSPTRDEWLVVLPESWPLVRGTVPRHRQTADGMADEIHRLLDEAPMEPNRSFVLIAPPQRGTH